MDALAPHPPDAFIGDVGGLEHPSRVVERVDPFRDLDPRPAGSRLAHRAERPRHEDAVVGVGPLDRGLEGGLDRAHRGHVIDTGAPKDPGEDLLIGGPLEVRSAGDDPIGGRKGRGHLRVGLVVHRPEDEVEVTVLELVEDGGQGLTGSRIVRPVEDH